MARNQMDTVSSAMIHVVEDDPAFRTALTRMLGAAGFAVKTYASAGDFLDAPHDGPGCIVLDLQLPDGSGLDVQRQLAERGEALPIVFLTGHGSIGGSVQAIRAGADDFLTKPVEASDLLAAVERAMERDRRRRGRVAWRADLQAKYDSLTVNERKVMSGVISGHLNKQIAYRFGRDLRTIKTYRAGVLRKMGAASTADLVRMADTLGIPIEPPDA
jgi:FixJ family two-component response regulator